MAGAFQPVEDFSSENSTLAPYGGLSSNRSLTIFPALSPSSVGGRRRDTFTAVVGRSTLPALPRFGRPSTPVIESAGRQVRLSTSSVRSLLTGDMPGRNG